MRVATTIIQVSSGSQEWVTALEPTCDPADHRAFLKSLPPGNQVGLVLETGGAVKRRKVTFNPSGGNTAKTKRKSGK